jgi:hypothetical protein
MGPTSGIGSPDRWAVHEERIYEFASDGCRNGFLAAPERYLLAPDEPLVERMDPEGEGRLWLDRAIEVAGGLHRLQDLQTVVLHQEEELDDGAVSRDMYFDHSGAFAREVTWTKRDETAEVTRWVSSRADRFAVEGGTVVPLLSEASGRAILRHAHRQPITHLWAYARGAMTPVMRGKGELNGDPALLVDVHHDGLTTTLYLDPDSARVLGLSWRGWYGSGVVREVVETMTEWTSVEGIRIATGRTITADGEPQDPAARCPSGVSFERETPGGLFDRPGAPAAPRREKGR